jgi:UDP-N-acetylmuramate--alanine ligase
VTEAISYAYPKMGRVKHIHFVGIGGAGMCGIAEVLHQEGYRVSGSDVSENKPIQHLREMGVTVYIGHDAQHVEHSDVVVRSTAIDDHNPEIEAAILKKIPVIPRAMMLAELMRFRHGIAVAGTHGKTTTTSLVTSVLQEGGLDPTFVIGGKLTSCGVNAQFGSSNYLVAEADESDASFLFLKPMMAVVTNIDADHMSTYQGSFSKLRATFVEFLHHLPFYGLAVVCVDDVEVRHILPKIQRPVFTYGFSKDAQYRAIDWKQEGLVSSFTAIRPSPHAPLKIELKWPGRHNVQNALAAIAIATELEISDTAIQNGLYNFQGVGRRFQILGERCFDSGKALVVDDYGHHPQEIRATVDAFRAVWPNKKLIHVFQPHRYSRTQDLFAQFVDVLRLGDEILLFDIYPAGEKPIAGVTSELLANAIESRGGSVRLVNSETLPLVLNEMIREGDVILMQGAGTISQYAHQLMQSS